MADANATNTPPTTLDDNDEALLAAQAWIAEWKACEAEVAHQKETREREAWEQLEREVGEVKEE